jgi:hypothetical protein
MQSSRVLKQEQRSSLCKYKCPYLDLTPTVASVKHAEMHKVAPVELSVEALVVFCELACWLPFCTYVQSECNKADVYKAE